MILAPFKWIVALFFNWSFAVFHDPGWAVVGMSVLLSLLLTPLYIWIERRKNSDKAKSAPMQAEINKIEAVYSGRERFYYTREIQRRYHYSPWTAMIPTLGLLVQIPFLLAAYHYLSELPVFNGAAFWYIKDLSKPDTIATIAGLPINLLAILMTVINLVSGWRYAESGKPKERIQYMAVAAIFLFLLYSCAASVVLYWTLSNALSLVRSEVFFRKNTSNVTDKSMSPEKILACASWVCTYLLTLAALLAVDAALLPGRPAFEWFALSKQLYGQSAFLVYFVFAVVFSMTIIRSRRGVVPLPYAFNFLGLLVLISIAIPFLGHYLRCPVDGAPILSWWNHVGVALGAIFAVVSISMGWGTAFPCAKSSMSETVQGNDGMDYVVGSLLAACVSLQICFCGPICAYASFPEGAPDVALSSLFLRGLLSVLSSVAVLCLVLRVLPLKARRKVLAFLILVAAVVFVYGNLLPADYGVLFHGSYGNAGNIKPSGSQLLLEAIVLAFVPLLARKVIFFLERNRRLLVISLGVLALTFIVRVGIALVKMPPMPDGNSNAAQADEKLFRFSKTAPNVVFLLLDNVLGQRFGLILDSDSRLKSAFDGFVWYPNTISASTFTFPDLPAIWGGEEYFPYKIGTSRTLGDVFTAAWDSYRARISDRGYRFSSSRMAQSFGGTLDGAERTFVELGYDARQKKNSGSAVNLLALKGNAIMRSIPYVLRTYIYDDGRWNCAEVDNPLSTAFDFLSDLVPNSEVVENPNGVYVHIHSEATHFPFVTIVNGKSTCIGIDSCYKWSLERVAEWLAWMKENGIYNNTRIVLCSDHGIGDAEGMSLDPRYAKNVDDMKKAAGGACPFFALLAVKDFQARGGIRADVSTKTVSHGTYFAFGEARFNDKVEEIVSSLVKNPYPPDWKNMNGFQILGNFRIVGDASDGKNWQRLTGASGK